MTSGFVRAGALVAALLAAGSSTEAKTITVGGDLRPNPQQTFNASGTVLGEAHATGNFTFLGIPATILNQSIPPLSLKSLLQIRSNVANTHGYVEWTLTDPYERTLTDLQNFDLDLMSGQSASFALNSFYVETTLFPIPVDVSGTLSRLSFDQTGSTITQSTGLGTGTFSIAGDLAATIDPLNVTIMSGAFSFRESIEISPRPFALTGNYSITPAVGGRHLALDGNVNLFLPLSLSTALATSSTLFGPALGITGAIDLVSTLAISASYHLEMFIPEPGSVVLLGIGLAGLAALGIFPHGAGCEPRKTLANGVFPAFRRAPGSSLAQDE